MEDKPLEEKTEYQYLWDRLHHLLDSLDLPALTDKELRDWAIRVHEIWFEIYLEGK